MIRFAFALLVGTSLSACTTANLADRLGTMKNPSATLEQPYGDNFLKRNPLIVANYNVLLEATIGAGPNRKLDVSRPTDMTKYLNAGFALSDIYCGQFFRDADESQRRRKYGRAITNDVGTAISTVLGLASAGETAVAASAAAFGLGDGLWRNYDEAFVVSPDLSNVKALVTTAQDVFRKDTFSSTLPADYGKAQSVIQRYADICSTLGMQALLNQAAEQQRQELQDKAKPTPSPSPTPSPTPSPLPSPTNDGRGKAAPQAIPG